MVLVCRAVGKLDLFFFSSKIKVQIENMFNTSNLVQVPYVKRIFMSILFFISELKDGTSNTFFNYERSNPNTHHRPHHTTPSLACDGSEQVKGMHGAQIGQVIALDYLRRPSWIQIQRKNLN
jgi:hypothetical protein